MKEEKWTPSFCLTIGAWRVDEDNLLLCTSVTVLESPGPSQPHGGREPTAPFPLEDRATGNLKDQTGEHFCPEQKAGSG